MIGRLIGKESAGAAGQPPLDAKGEKSVTRKLDRLHMVSANTIAHKGGDEARSAILDAAATSFMHKGFAGTSIDDMADELGATKGRIYHYYKSKTDIFLDVHLEALRVLLESVGAVARRPGLSHRERLFEMCRTHSVVFMTTISYQKSTILGINQFLISITHDYQTEASQRVHALREEYESLFAKVIEQGQAAGVFRQVSPRFATKPLLGALNWANSWYKALDDENRNDQYVLSTGDALASYCVNALLA